MRGIPILIAALAILPTLPSGAAWAQNQGEYFQRDRNTSVLERPRNEFIAPPAQHGAFFVKAEAELGVSLDNNIYATTTNTESDVVASFQPSFEAESTWSRHALSASASAIRREYLDFTSESVWNAEVGVSGRADIQRGFFLDGAASMAMLTENRSSAGAALLAAEPIEYDTANFSAGATYTTGRVRINGAVSAESHDYDDARLIAGGVADQDFRDYTETAISARVDGAVSPAVAVFARASQNQRNYDAPAAGSPNRDSDGYVVEMGVDFDIGGTARGSIAAGVLKQSYDDAVFTDIDGASVNAQVEWFPTALTTIEVSATRAPRESAITASAGYTETQISGRVDHELLRNLILSARVSFGDDEYSGIDRTDERFEAMASASWLMNRRVGVQASFTHLDVESSGAAARGDFDNNIARISVSLRM
ncbi:outer membrane beta-barrel protein [Maricaulis sp.]|uniref:outer membrane beta-barrel protein n=1 Tax=Maricaulis sp. TaxID=1486257 RepID=UPI003A94C3D4